MLGMQEEMLNQLTSEVEKLKLMLLAKKQVENKPTTPLLPNSVHNELEFQSSSTTRMAGTAKAMIPPGISKLQHNFTGKRSGAETLSVNKKKGK